MFRSKHHSIATNKSDNYPIHLTRGSPQVSNADQVETRSLGWGQASWGEGRWGSPPQVVVDMDDGEMRVVEPVLSRAIAFLEAEMALIEAAAKSGTG